MSVGVKLAAGSMVIVGSLICLAYLGASSSWQYYLTADECLAQGAKLTGQRLRVSGRVVPGSIRTIDDQEDTTFALQAAAGQLHVRCTGPLPDSFAEEQEVVVEGRLQRPGLIVASQVLTRCASKYEPR